MAAASSAFSTNDAIPVPFWHAPVRRVVNQKAPVWMPSVLERIQDLLRLPDNWNGYGAKAVTMHHVEFALSMLAVACPMSSPKPEVVPGDNGDLQVEWHSLEYDIELHVRAPLHVTAVRHTGDHCEEIDLENDFNIVYGWLLEMEDAIAARAAAA